MTGHRWNELWKAGSIEGTAPHFLTLNEGSSGTRLWSVGKEWQCSHCFFRTVFGKLWLLIKVINYCLSKCLTNNILKHWNYYQCTALQKKSHNINLKIVYSNLKSLLIKRVEMPAVIQHILETQKHSILQDTELQANPDCYSFQETVVYVICLWSKEREREKLN